MMSLGKHIDRLDLRYPIIFRHYFDVACLGCRITAYVDDLFRPCRDD